MIVLVCGGRDFGDLKHVLRGSRIWREREAEFVFAMSALDDILHPSQMISDDMDTWLPKDVRIITGGARGADDVGASWAAVNWTDYKEYKADWSKHGNAAGVIRNQQMLDEEAVDLVIAFPGGRGTADMVRRAREAKIPVMEVAYEMPKV